MLAELEDTSAISDSAERELDTNVPPPLAMVALAVDVAMEEISKLLQEIPSAQQLALEASERGVSPKLWVSPNQLPRRGCRHPCTR